MNVAVIGAGTMGSGIAQVCSGAGHRVRLYDISNDALAKARGGIEASVARLASKGKLTEVEAQALREGITYTTDLGELADSEIVIEAVFEDIDVKRETWQELRRTVPDTALLASNTSSLSISELAPASGTPERFCGMHFFNPVPILPLVEVVRGLNTEEATITRAREFVSSLGKTPIVCEDKPGFIVNRLLIPYVNDAVHALSEGVASADDIDAAMKLGANMPIGPLALADLIGLDVTLAAIESLYREFGDPKFRPAPELRQRVRAGKLGRKSGEGFHTYE